ncbi:gamma-glutamyltransferase [uncultured Paludibaculum sp.]|uniref:gamma-glutamyltransferase n=1 Tax=uncultured Paludibaculum sp. TaxID=1765020 RepID=UPI002AABDAF5|nr:gamma-glutamyltransferase [uncultured Paludibaculum sp.]
MRNARVFAALALVCALTLPAAAREPVRTRKAMVVSQEPNATDAGVAVLKSGGNAVDAAVAVAMTLAVTHPRAGNLGGGGFMLIRLANGTSTFIDFRERAPLSATRTMYVDKDGKRTKDSQVGWRAAGVPGTARGLEYAHKKYGTKPWATLLKPAIDFAAQGVTLTYAEARNMCANRAVMEPFAESKRIFLKGGVCLEPGEKLVQPELAQVLTRLAKSGANDFYEGVTARIFSEESKKAGGEITLEDLKGYKVYERKPLIGEYKGYQIITAPPPSSGGLAMFEMLGMLRGTDYEKAGAGSASSTHYMAEAMRRAYADRARYVGDPGFVKIPLSGLINPTYTKKVWANFDPEKATPSSAIQAGDPAPYESSETTHFNVLDEQGNAVALTYTINGLYGNGVTVPRLGFLLNNEMDDFTTKPGEANMFGTVEGEANAIQPRKTPLSSMTPTIVTKDNQPFLLLGAPGGSRIINAVTQVLLYVIDFGMDVQQAIDQPRFHHQWLPDTLYLEPGFSPDTRAALEKMGYQVAGTTGVASVEAIMVERPKAAAASRGGVVADGATATGARTSNADTWMSRITWIAAAQNGRSSGKAAGY